MIAFFGLQAITISTQVIMASSALLSLQMASTSVLRTGGYIQGRTHLVQ